MCPQPVRVRVCGKWNGCCGGEYDSGYAGEIRAERERRTERERLAGTCPVRGGPQALERVGGRRDRDGRGMCYGE